MRSLSLRTALFSLFLLFNSPVSAEDAANTQLETLMENYWEASLKASPLSASLDGDKRYQDQIDDLSESAFEARLQHLDDMITELHKVKREQLSVNNQLNYRVFDWILRHKRKTLDYNWHHITFTTYHGWHSGFASAIKAIRYVSEKDYRDLLKRLQAFDTYAEQNMAWMEKGVKSGYVQPCEVLSNYEDTISGYIAEDPESSAFFLPFKAVPGNWDEPLKKALRTQARQVVEDVLNPSYRRYLTFFQKTYKPACRKAVGLSSIPRGHELYNHFVRYYTSLETDADAVHKLGLSEVTRIRKAMQSIMNEVQFEGDFADFLQHLRTDKRFYLTDADEYMRYVAAITKTIDGKLPEFFARLPRNSYDLARIPEQTAPTATTAYYQSGAANGTRAGRYFVNTYDLASRPLYELPALSLHESVPGHHLQISLQQELPDLPKLRTHHYFHAFGEGWGLYAERLGEEMGIYTTPYERFGRLIYDMWRATRLVVDTGIHVKGWSRQQAIDYMMVNTGLAVRNITVEVDRYISWPGQALAYKHGELKFVELRQRAEAALGEKFSLRDFHTAALGNGSLPLTVLDDVMSEWITAQK
ncbi:MAG: DUF885 domain-containing protein [Pseudomonadota bacterium]